MIISLTCDGESWAKSQMLVSAQLPRTANLEMHKLYIFFYFYLCATWHVSNAKKDTLNSWRFCFPTIWPLFESLEMQWGMLFFNPSIKMFAISIKRMYTIQPCLIAHWSRRLLGLFQFVEPLTKVCNLNVEKKLYLPSKWKISNKPEQGDVCTYISIRNPHSHIFFFPSQQILSAAAHRSQTGSLILL